MCFCYSSPRTLCAPETRSNSSHVLKTSQEVSQNPGLLPEVLEPLSSLVPGQQQHWVYNAGLKN